MRKFLCWLGLHMWETTVETWWMYPSEYERGCGKTVEIRKLRVRRCARCDKFGGTTLL